MNERSMVDLKGKRILVTGGAGFIGSHIVDLLVKEDVTAVTVIDNMIRGRMENLAAATQHGIVRVIDGDIRDHELMNRLVSDADIVFHQAALRITHCAAEPRHAMEAMVNASYDLLELCVAHKIEKVIAASSASVYGMAEAFPIGESHHSYDNRTLYGTAKTFLEGILRCFKEMYGLDYLAFRYFNAYGPRMDLHGRYTEVLVRWMDRIRGGEPPLIFGDGKQTMDFVDVRDIARANILGAKSAVSDEAFNIASGIETSLTQLAKQLLEVMNSPLQPEYRPERKVNPVQRRLADVRKAERLLGFRSQITLEHGLRDFVTWWQAERDAKPLLAIGT